jgi:hypothetical protein
MKTLATMAAIAALVGGVTMASAQQGGAPGQPKESGQAEERGPMGRTGGSATNPSPMAPAASGTTTGTAPKDTSKGQPNEQGQQQERGPAGGTGGSTQNPPR